MVSRKSVFPVLLATAAGTPYLLLDENLSTALTQQAAAVVSGSAPSDSATGSPATPAGLPGALPSEFGYGRAAQDPQSATSDWITGAPVGDLGEVIRFDIPPAWVIGRWPRVTTTLSETGLEGFRVPLVTGTQIDDLAGSLTYYFDRQHRVQRLTFEGFTGDDRRLAALGTQYYGLQHAATLNAGMYVASWNGVPTSVLRISRASVVSAASPHAQLQVFLELNRPGMTFGLSPAAHQLLQHERSSLRW
jgi:hypothetical protein